ncbi:ribosome assembly RNA-binding protein YhbY [Psychrobacillus lasiicapitis]|uniref:Ribosome assembly RNA-binding protein YhbY n=1 Tax=Psychrobacillus lasiicapitis TaxID=1636719 RepID=A0A544TA15_9BACI|nr:ribosome assembly RNA-binding protein YhbY [Psychrobacillus lasiicapitis]TQR14276.1 ribosome assembly RNA-binding protein YhbY [Psychrobacillus lasiicapitis]GGA32678.1 putative RNA-binding protein YqeI [Psychrobacillus lasiicapitis]
MLTGKQKRFLRSQAHHLSPIFQVGKGGVNDAMIKQIGEALEVRELIKISILQNCEDEKQEVAEALAKGAGAELVQLIGLTVVLYKTSKNNKRIELPKASRA